MKNSKHTHGKCLCGSVSLTCTLEKDTFDACHCGMCRKWGGGPAMCVEAGADLQFQGKEFISSYNSSDWAERGFCKQCGTHLFYRLKSGKFTSLPLGLIDNAENLKFDVQIFIDNKPTQYDFANKTKMMTQSEVEAAFTNTPRS